MFYAAAKLLPAITNTLWPGYSTLPRWHVFEARLRNSTDYGSLAQFVADHQIHSLDERQTALSVTLVELGLQWNPLGRCSMGAMADFVLENFPLLVSQGCQPEQRHREQGSTTLKDEPETSLAVPLSEPTFTCNCSGDCGQQP